MLALRVGNQQTPTNFYTPGPELGPMLEPGYNPPFAAAVRLIEATNQVGQRFAALMTAEYLTVDDEQTWIRDFVVMLADALAVLGLLRLKASLIAMLDLARVQPNRADSNFLVMASALYLWENVTKFLYQDLADPEVWLGQSIDQELNQVLNDAREALSLNQTILLMVATIAMSDDAPTGSKERMNTVVEQLSSDLIEYARQEAEDDAATLQEVDEFSWEVMSMNEAPLRELERELEDGPGGPGENNDYVPGSTPFGAAFRGRLRALGINKIVVARRRLGADGAPAAPAASGAARRWQGAASKHWQRA